MLDTNDLRTFERYAANNPAIASGLEQWRTQFNECQRIVADKRPIQEQFERAQRNLRTMHLNSRIGFIPADERAETEAAYRQAVAARSFHRGATCRLSAA